VDSGRTVPPTQLPATPLAARSDGGYRRASTSDEADGEPIGGPSAQEVSCEGLCV